MKGFLNRILRVLAIIPYLIIIIIMLIYGIGALPWWIITGKTYFEQLGDMLYTVNCFMIDIDEV